jgi:hypothetical protein
LQADEKASRFLFIRVAKEARYSASRITNATRPHSLGDGAAINVLVRISAIADETSCPHQIGRDIAFARYYRNWKLTLVRDKQNHSKKARCVECGVTE